MMRDWMSLFPLRMWLARQVCARRGHRLERGVFRGMRWWRCTRCLMGDFEHAARQRDAA